MSQRLAILVLLALLVRAVVPVGFMLAPLHAGSAGITVVICTEHGTQALVLDEDGEPLPSDRAAVPDICPFAFSALPGLASEATQLSATVAYASVTYTLAVFQFSLTPLPGAASARGPPRAV